MGAREMLEMQPEICEDTVCLWIHVHRPSNLDHTGDACTALLCQLGRTCRQDRRCTSWQDLRHHLSCRRGTFGTRQSSQLQRTCHGRS